MVGPIALPAIGALTRDSPEKFVHARACSHRSALQHAAGSLMPPLTAKDRLPSLIQIGTAHSSATVLDNRRLIVAGIHVADRFARLANTWREVAVGEGCNREARHSMRPRPQPNSTSRRPEALKRRGARRFHVVLPRDRRRVP